MLEVNRHADNGKTCPVTKTPCLLKVYFRDVLTLERLLQGSGEGKSGA